VRRIAARTDDLLWDLRGIPARLDGRKGLAVNGFVLN